MRYPANRKAETRQKLIEKAGALAKKDGFATTGVDGLMATVGLTGGAFYSHFDSKTELLKEIISKELAVSQGFIAGQGTNIDPAQVIRAYLSPLHVNFPELGCILPSLTNEVARSDASVKIAFEQGLQAIQQKLVEQLGDEASAWAMLALSVGTISLARAMNSPELQARFLAANTQFAIDTVAQLALPEKNN